MCWEWWGRSRFTGKGGKSFGCYYHCLLVCSLVSALDKVAETWGYLGVLLRVIDSRTVAMLFWLSWRQGGWEALYCRWTSACRGDGICVLFIHCWILLSCPGILHTVWSMKFVKYFMKLCRDWNTTSLSSSLCLSWSLSCLFWLFCSFDLYPGFSSMSPHWNNRVELANTRIKDSLHEPTDSRLTRMSASSRQRRDTNTKKTDKHLGWSLWFTPPNGVVLLCWCGIIGEIIVEVSKFYNESR